MLFQLDLLYSFDVTRATWLLNILRYEKNGSKSPWSISVSFVKYYWFGIRLTPIFLYLFVSENTEMFFKLSFECSVVKLMLEHPNFYIKNNDSISLNNFKHNLLNTSCLLSWVDLQCALDLIMIIGLPHCITSILVAIFSHHLTLKIYIQE
jgi:hypothetical protein